MGAPGEGSHEGAKDVVPADPGTVLEGAGELLELGGTGDGGGADAGEDEGEHAEEAGGHLGHDGAEDLGGGVLTLPGHVLGLGHEEGGLVGLAGGNEGGADGTGGRLGDEGRRDGNEDGKKDEAEAGHFWNVYIYVCDLHLFVGEGESVEKRCELLEKRKIRHKMCSKS